VRLRELRIKVLRHSLVRSAVCFALRRRPCLLRHRLVREFVRARCSLRQIVSLLARLSLREERLLLCTQNGLVLLGSRRGYRGVWSGRLGCCPFKARLLLLPSVARVGGQLCRRWCLAFLESFGALGILLRGA